MSVIVISSDSPSFVCTSPASYIDVDDIGTIINYAPSGASSCDVNEIITIGGGTSGADGADGTDGRGITSVIRTVGDGSPGTTDTYTITYTDLSTSTFNVTHGTNGSTGATGTAATIAAGTTTTGNAGTDASVVNSGTSSAAILDFTIPRGADGADGATITTGAGVPSGGDNDDLYINETNYDLYKKISGVWTIIGNVQGATGSTGAAGTDGIDGDQWVFSDTLPIDSSVNTYDVYHVYTDNNSIYYKQEGLSTWSFVTNFNGDKYNTTSINTINLSTLVVGNSVTVNLEDDYLDYSVGQFAVCANSITNKFVGEITSYSDSSIDAPVFTGIGLDDMTSLGTYTYGLDLDYVVKIDGTGTPDTFTWSDDGGSTWDAATVSITGDNQLLSNGVSIKFTATTGHTLNEQWDFTANAPALVMNVSSITGTANLSSWSVNSTGITAADLNIKWYLVEATAGTGTVTSRVYTNSYGWTVDSADNVTTTNLGTNPSDLIIKHDLNKNVVDVKIFRVVGSTTKDLLMGAAAYNRLSNDGDQMAVELGAFATDLYPLNIYVTFED